MAESSCPLGRSPAQGAAGGDGAGPWRRFAQRLGLAREAPSPGTAARPPCGAGSSSAGDSTSGGCPIPSSSSAAAPAYNPLANDERFGQERAPGQRVPLSTERAVSTIPKPPETTPDHQPKGAAAWVYPSEQQYFNALHRKGWEPRENDMPVVVAIHNAVNEQGWTKIKEWERLRGEGSGDPKLERFRGRPGEMTPKAWLMTNLLGYAPPFDRHDWEVRRGNGADATARYVIDFYAGKPSQEKPVALHLDVRPALDSFDAVLLRARMFQKDSLAPMARRFAAAFGAADDGSGSGKSGAAASPDEPPAAAGAQR